MCDVERDSDMFCQDDSEITTSEKTQQMVKDIMRRAAVLVKAASDLPRRGDDFELCNSFSMFTAFMEQQETRIRLLLSGLMRNTGCPTRLPKINADVEEYLERIVLVDDHIVERTGIVMDELDRGGREDVEIPKTVIGAESTKKRKAEAEAAFQEQVHVSDPGSILAEKLRLAHVEPQYKEITKPQKQYGFESSIDNSHRDFIPKLRHKHHALPRKESAGVVIIDEDAPNSMSQSQAVGNDATESHPYIYEIRNFVIPHAQLESKIPLKMLDLDKTPLTMVKTVEDLVNLKDHLNHCREFAVDLEHHDFRSYLGFTCLIQISTRNEDFIVDPFPLWNDMHVLNEPFTDPTILKVFHGAEHDIEWLQRDFGIYVVNMFDTGRAMRLLEMQKYNLRYLVSHYCGVTLTKIYQLADWRVRPLDNDMITYARSDTHYLLYCYDCLREDLLTKGSTHQNLLHMVYCESALICSRLYQKPIFDKDGYRGLGRRRINNRQDAAMQVLWHWRDRVAREEDESVQYVLPNHMLATIAESLPREHQAILRCCNPVPPLVRECVQEIQKMIFKCRDLPLIESNNEAIDEMYDELLRRRKMRGKYTKGNILIICPLDFSQTEFDEEIGNQMQFSAIDDNSAVVERNPTHTLLSVLDSASLVGNSSTVDRSSFIVVDKKPTIEKIAMDKIVKRLQSTGTPYESYTIATNQARNKEKETSNTVGMSSEHEGEVEPSTNQQKLYSHHDSPAKRHTIAKNLDVNEANIDLNESSDRNIVSSFADCQILTKRKMKQARRVKRQNVDIPTGFPTGEGPSHATKRSKHDCEEHLKKVKKFDYSQREMETFSQPEAGDSSFDPFGQKFRLENKKNFRHRPLGGHHRMGTMSMGFKPSAKK